MNVGSVDEQPAPASSRARSFSRWVLLALLPFVVAVSIRLPSCYESFWVDELHSAWAVWDGQSEVSGRATLGHQSPFYFHGLWVWKQLVGGSEVAMRLSSVFAVALACVILAIGVAVWSKSFAGGLAAGMALALESNCLFFGTELRPYSFVILSSAVAVVCFVVLSRQRSRAGWAWPVLILAILLTALFQPTGLGVLVWLPFCLLFWWGRRDWRSTLRPTATDFLLLTSTLIVAYFVWRETLQPTWQNKQAWASFATARDLGQLWRTWPWTWLVAVPVAIGTSIWLTGRDDRKTRTIFLTTILLAGIAVASTTSYWLVAKAEWLPIWHRRYYVAVLPILACVVGGAIGMVTNDKRLHPVVAYVLTTTVLLGLTFQQGILLRVRAHPVAFVRRGEDWRSAVRFVNQHLEADSLVYVDGGLIEGRYLTGAAGNRSSVLPPTVSTDEQRSYLTFPVNGPYRIDGTAFPIDPAYKRLPDYSSLPANHPRHFVLARRPKHRLPKDRFPESAQIYRFANVSVIVVPGFDEKQKLDQEWLRRGD